MENHISHEDRRRGALYGMFIGDALAMPVHWYYNTFALRMDYGEIHDYAAPANPHPDSILHRSKYRAKNKKGDILHDQSQYWGKPGVHYHQFLQPGENTLNIKLARELMLQLHADKEYSENAWLNRMIDYLTTPGNHNDTYAEEYLRHFFSRYSDGVPPRECGRQDEKHIGGFSLMLPLVIALSYNPEKAKDLAIRHLQLTHGGEMMKRWGTFLCFSLLALLDGVAIEESVKEGIEASHVDMDESELRSLSSYPDETVVCRHFSSACYVHLSVPATIYLALKYADRPEQALITNTMCGGDNCGRGAVLGALLGAIHGLEAWPRRWVENLVAPPPELTPEGLT